MPTYGFTINPPISPHVGDSAGSYVVVDEPGFELLDYGAISASPPSPISSNPVSNYRLTFSVSGPTPHPSIGQIWPRGSGQA